MVTGKESNSQSNISLVSGFMNQDFDSGATARYTLFIFVGPQEIAGLVCDSSNNPIAGEHYHDIELNDENGLKKLFSHSDVFNHLFKHVHIYTALPNEISTPIDWIESNEDENMLRHASGKQNDFTIQTYIDSRHKWIFGLPKALHKLIKSTYKHISVTPLFAHKTSFLISNLGLLISGNTIMLFDNNENNAWKNTLTFDNEQSTLFAALSYAEIYNLAPENLTISLFCNEMTKQQIAPVLTPYFKEVKLLSTNSLNNQELESYILHLLQKLAYAHH